MHSTAPAASARVRMVPSSIDPPSWPTLTASAITSTPRLSIIHRTATEVSRPPLYARTTRLAITAPVRSSESGERAQLAGDLGTGRLLRDDHEDGVITRDGAQDRRQAGAVDRRRDDVR